jgi:hypothetical protein
MAPIGHPDSVLGLDTHKELVAALSDERRRSQGGTLPEALLPDFINCTSAIYQHPTGGGSLGLDQRRGLLKAVIDRIEVAPHPKGVQTHPVSADLIASRLDIRWLA